MAAQNAQPVAALPGTSMNGRARAVALQAAARVEARPTSLVPYQSAGSVVIIGPADRAFAAAAQLHPRLACTVLVSDRAGGRAAGARSAAKPPPDIPVAHEKPVQVTGHFGQFSVIVAAPPPAGGANLLQKLGGTRTHFDLVLDLTDPPFLRQALPPFGYYAPGNDPERLRRALAELPDMLGEFEKPRFFRYDPDICAHSRSGLTGCTRCLDTCPAGAIISMAGEIAVDPYLCQGVGVCATACPSGAITYVYPSAADGLARLRALLRAYHDAGGTQAAILFHDAEAGRARIAGLTARLPEHVIPVELAELASVGLETWLAALAYGAAEVALLDTPETPLSVRDELGAQLSYAGAILEGMGYRAARVRLLEADADAAAAFAVPTAGTVVPAATFAGMDEKRTNLRLAIDHLHAHAPAPRPGTALPAGAPFGEIHVNREACTLCMACVSVCPAGALANGNDMPQLNFIEGNCVQCGLCRPACPEDAITLAPRFLYDPGQRRAARALHEEPPFCCVSCGKPLATRKMMERMTEKLRTHRMFRTPEAMRRVQMCGDCRVRDVYRAEAGWPGAD